MTPRFACPVCEGEAHPTRARVFCASLADVFEDRPEVAPWREELFGLIGNTPNLDWLLLTKRPENVNDMFFDMVAPVRLGWEDFPNIWIGTSVENQEQASRRIPHLLQIPATVRFLSMEPLLGPVDLTDVAGDNALKVTTWEDVYEAWRGTSDDWEEEFCEFSLEPKGQPPTGAMHHALNWVIVGGESGHHARPMHPDWARCIRDQCVAAGVDFHFKQFGEFVPFDNTVSMHEMSRETGFVHRNGRYWKLSKNGPNFEGNVEDVEMVMRVGKHAAGRLLDGRTWDQFPEVTQ